MNEMNISTNNSIASTSSAGGGSQHGEVGSQGEAAGNNIGNTTLSRLQKQVTGIIKQVASNFLATVGTPTAFIRQTMGNLPVSSFDSVVVGGSQREGREDFFEGLQNPEVCPISAAAFDVVKQTIQGADHVNRRGQELEIHDNMIMNFFAAGGHFTSDSAQMYDNLNEAFNDVLQSDNLLVKDDDGFINRDSTSSHYLTSAIEQKGVNVYIPDGEGDRRCIGHILYGKYHDENNEVRSYVQTESYPPDDTGHALGVIDNYMGDPNEYIQSGLRAPELNTADTNEGDNVQEYTVLMVQGSEKATRSSPKGCGINIESGG